VKLAMHVVTEMRVVSVRKSRMGTLGFGLFEGPTILQE